MRWGRACLGIVLGAVLTAVALNMFLIPNRIAAGGTSGLATVLHHLFALPVGMTTMAFDIPLLLLSIKMLASIAVAKTMLPHWKSLYSGFSLGCPKRILP